jgi:hypothetical protein
LTRNISKKKYKSEEFTKKRLALAKQEQEINIIRKREEIDARMKRAKEVRKVTKKVDPEVKKFLGKIKV